MSKIDKFWSFINKNKISTPKYFDRYDVEIKEFDIVLESCGCIVIPYQDKLIKIWDGYIGNNTEYPKVVWHRNLTNRKRCIVIGNVFDNVEILCNPSFYSNFHKRLEKNPGKWPANHW